MLELVKKNGVAFAPTRVYDQNNFMIKHYVKPYNKAIMNLCSPRLVINENKELHSKDGLTHS